MTLPLKTFSPTTNILKFLYKVFFCYCFLVFFFCSFSFFVGFYLGFSRFVLLWLINHIIISWDDALTTWRTCIIFHSQIFKRYITLYCWPRTVVILLCCFVILRWNNFYYGTYFISTWEIFLIFSAGLIASKLAGKLILLVKGLRQAEHPKLLNSCGL